jgi:hypothetical protein
MKRLGKSNLEVGQLKFSNRGNGIGCVVRSGISAAAAAAAAGQSFLFACINRRHPDE